MDKTSAGQITLHLEVLPRATKRAFLFLSQQSWLRRSQWYLAGGTALALYEGHRQSLDLDFFLPKSNFNLTGLLSHFEKVDWKSDIIQERTVYGRLLGAKVSFIAYPFFLPKKITHYGALPLLTPSDIAVMKIVAISQRGKKRDFFDLYWYVTHREPLIDVVRRLPAQYPTVAHNFHHIMKSLAYFADAENDQLPRLFFSATWEQVKKYFTREVPRVARQIL